MFALLIIPAGRSMPPPSGPLQPLVLCLCCRLRLVKPSPRPEQTDRLHGAPLQSSSSRCSQSAGAGQNPQPSSQSTRTGLKSSFIPSSRHDQFRHHQCVASEGSASREFFSFFFLHAARNKTGRLPVWPLQTEGRSLCSDPNQNNKRTIFIVCAGCSMFIYTLFID